MSPRITPQVRKDIIKEDRAEGMGGSSGVRAGGMNGNLNIGGGGRPRKNSI